jgi:hypothetical protein
MAAPRRVVVDCARPLTRPLTRAEQERLAESLGWIGRAWLAEAARASDPAVARTLESHAEELLAYAAAIGPAEV